MFFKRLFFVFLIYCLPAVSFAFDFKFSELSCFKDIKKYYPGLINGSLNWSKQKRFFNCLRGTLELVVEDKVFIHDPGRDYFTKEDLFRIFNMHFGYPPDFSSHLTERVFVVKKVLIGGSADKLRDQELRSLYELMGGQNKDKANLYLEVYFLLHKQIPVLKKVFNEESFGIIPEQKKKALKQIRKSFVLLEQAYIKENVVYQIDDLYRYGEYFKKSRLIREGHRETVKQGFLFLHNLFEGLFFPKKEIRGEGWRAALRSLYSTINLFFHYKTYFVERPFAPGERAYRTLRSSEILISSLRAGKTTGNFTGSPKGFPLRNLDQMFSVLFSFLNQTRSVSASANGFFTNFNPDQTIPLLTRTLNCFSLDNSPEKNCKSEWGSNSSSSVVTLHFSDRQFEVFPDRVESRQTADTPPFIEWGKLDALKQWLVDYRRSAFDIHRGKVRLVAESRQFDHWLYPFFGWEKNSRIEFGSFRSSENYEKFYQLLHYQAFLPLLFSSYLPEDFFYSDKKELPSISFKTWRRMVQDISPALAVLTGAKGYDPSWSSSLYNLFSFADSFLYSSNRDEHLNIRELIDLTVHMLEGMKTVKLAYDKLSNKCVKPLKASCAVENILQDQDILAAYPRFQQYLFNSQMGKYWKRMVDILGGPEKPVQAFSLFPLFVLIQTAELNYELTDKNHSFNLESEELSLFAKKYENHLADAIPYISTTDQAHSYLMYSFKTGNIPFFTGEPFAPIEFVNWHLDSKNRRPFTITPNEFHFLVFDFYNLYQI